MNSFFNCSSLKRCTEVVGFQLLALFLMNLPPMSYLTLPRTGQSLGSSHALIFTLGTVIITFRAVAIIISFYWVSYFLCGWNIEVPITGMEVSHSMLVSILVMWIVSYLGTFSFTITDKVFLRMEIESSVMYDFSNQITLTDYFRNCGSTWAIESCRVRKTQSDAIGTLSLVQKAVCARPFFLIYHQLSIT